MAEAGYGGARCAHRPTTVDDDPDRSFARDDCLLVDEPVLAVSRRTLRSRRLRRLRDVRDHVEGQASVRAERDRNDVLEVVEVGKEEVAVLVESQTRVAARVAEAVGAAADGVTGRDDSLRPGLSAVERDSLEETGEALAYVRHDDDVLRIRRIHGDSLFRLVPDALADVDIRRNRPASGWDRDERERDEDRQDANERPFHHHSPPLEWSGRGYTCDHLACKAGATS